MSEVVRIAPTLSDDDLVSWIGEGALTQGVAKRFGWDVDETRRHLEKLARAGLLVKELVSMDASANITGGRHAEWKSAESAKNENREQENTMSAAISNGDVFITRGSESLSDAVRVDSIEEDTVHFFPYGGGRLVSGPVETFTKQFETISAARITELSNVLNAGEFGFDEGKDYPGYASSQLWNGYFEPAFERSTIEDMMAEGFINREEGYGQVAWFDDNGVFFLVKTVGGEYVPQSITSENLKRLVNDDNLHFVVETETDSFEFEVEKVEGKTVMTEDGEKMLYGFGKGWVWQRADKPGLSPST